MLTPRSTLSNFLKELVARTETYGNMIGTNCRSLRTHVQVQKKIFSFVNSAMMRNKDIGEHLSSPNPRRMRLVTLLTWFCLLCNANALSFTSEVVGVLDANTIDVLRDGKEERIRLRGIDCPEKGQPFGNTAKHATAALIYAKNVNVQSYGKDKDGRTLADVVRIDGTNINQELVKAGWCWWYRKYAPNDTTLEHLETEARGGRKGLWADPEPVPPWEWRKRSP